MSKEKLNEEVQETQEAQEEIVITGDMPVYPGGPTGNQLDEWKEQHGNVYLVEFEPGEAYLFRAISRREFKELARIDDKDTMNREERVCEICVLWPQNYDFVAMNEDKAGIPTIISEEVMIKSGFNPSNTIEL